MASIAAVESRRELRSERFLLGNQLIALVFLAAGGIVMLAVQQFFPGFFHHPNLTWSVSASTLGRLWPLFTYGAVMATLGAIGLGSTNKDSEIFTLSVITSFLAGIWEEIGYRWFFVCTAMISLVFLNWLIGSFAWITGIVVLTAGAVIAVSGWGKGRGLFGFGLVIAGCVILYFALSMNHHDPVFWFYRTFTVPFVNFITFGTMKDILHNPAIPPLFIFGMISANGKFSDGHKYQGWVGQLNSWIIGLVMMNVVIRYGIGTAIAAHAIYDLEYALIRYASRRYFG
jgi:hypothetical protein